MGALGWIMVFVGLVAAAPATKANTAALEACERIDDGDRRLACILAVPRTAPEPPKIDHGQWETFDATDRITGERRVGTVLRATQTVIAPQRRQEIHDKTGRLQITCRDGKPSVMFWVEDQLVADHSARVSYRFDDKPPVTRAKWQKSTNSTAAGLWGPKAFDFIGLVERSKELVWRVQNDVFGTTEMEFNLAGATHSLIVFHQRCRR
jgi:hypothetical protein